MPSLVYDYADIASRMKGELKPEVEIMPIPPNTWLNRTFCAQCHGSGMAAGHGGTCMHCHGLGVSP